MEITKFNHMLSFEDHGIEYLLEDGVDLDDYIDGLNGLHPNVEVSVGTDNDTYTMHLAYNHRSELKEFFARQWASEGGPAPNAVDIEEFIAQLEQG